MKEPEYLRDKILTSPVGDRMCNTVTPMYDASYVGLWMFQGMGLEYDLVWKLVDQMREQLFVETCTWAIELWEKRYGIKPDDSIPLQERRDAVIRVRDGKHSMAHYNLLKYIEDKTGGKASVTHNVASYTFAINIETQAGMASIDLFDLVDYVSQMKPAHLSWKVGFLSHHQSIAYYGIAMLCSTHTHYSVAGVDPDTLMNWLVDELDNALTDENDNVLFE